MVNQSVDQKPSETALFAALRRALANKNYPDQKFGSDYLAEYLLPPHFRFFLKFTKIQQNTSEKLNEALPGLTEYMIARTIYFDELFKKALQEDIPQIVLLGAGYDTRALRFIDTNKITRIYELDISPTQERKITILKKAKVEIPVELKFVPIDFNRDSLLDTLQGAGWRSSMKTLFIWEGVSYYLEKDSVSNTLNFVSQQAASGSSLAFDYTITLTDETVYNYYGAADFKQTMAEHHKNEALLFSLPEGKVTDFLADHNLFMLEHLSQDEIEKKYLTDEKGHLIGPMTGHFRFVLASSSS